MSDPASSPHSRKSNVSTARSRSSTDQITPDTQQNPSQTIPRSPGKLSRAKTRVTDAARSLLPNKTHAGKSSSPTQSTQSIITQNIIGEPYEYTWDPSAPPGVRNPAPSDPEVAKLFEEFHRWDDQTRVIDPALWQRRVRLRCFRLFQRKKRGGDESIEGDINQGNAYTGNCLADADLFVHRLDGEDIAVLGDGDRPLYKDMYGFTPEEVVAVRGTGILIDAVNKSGTLAVEENLIHYFLANIREMVQTLYAKLTDSVLDGQDERTYSKEFLEEVLKVKGNIDEEFKRLEKKSADMRVLKVDEDKVFIRLAEERSQRWMLSESRRNSGAAPQVEMRRESSSSSIPSRKPWEEQWRRAQ